MPLRILVRFLAALLMLAAGPALAQSFPKFTGLVVDEADKIPPDREAALTARLQAFQQQTGRQLVIATIADAQGYPIEDYGYRLGRAWGLGLKGANNGVLLLIFPNNPPGQRGPRIEVGYGLEPVLTDALSSIIVREKMMPLLRRNDDIPGALEAGAEAIIQQLSLPDAEAQRAQAEAIEAFNRSQAGRRSSGGGDGPPIGLIFWMLVVGFVLLSVFRGRGRKYKRARGPWGGKRHRSNDDWPIWLWAASEIASSASRSRGGGWGGGWGGSGGGGGGGWLGGGFTGGGGGSFGGGGASGDW